MGSQGQAVQMVYVPQGGQTMATNQQQQVVVVQQQPAAGQPVASEEVGDRFPRWPYLIFGIAMCVYHGCYFWVWFIWSFILSFLPGGYGALFFFCGAVPAGVTFCWLIADSTVFCANPGTGRLTKMCCCQCVNGYIMAIPIAIGAILRVILWIAFFGIAADILNDFDDGETAIDNFFWGTLSLAAFDVGPLCVLAIDWWLYYGKADFNGILGHKNNPLRCATAQQIVIFLISWAFIAMFEELGDPQFLWPWICHGVIATAVLIFAAFLQFSGSIKGANVSNGVFKWIAWGMATMIAIFGLIIWGYLFSWIFHPILAIFTGVWLAYGLYYTGMVLPTVWALFSIRSGMADTKGQMAVAQSVQTP